MIVCLSFFSKLQCCVYEKYVVPLHLLPPLLQLYEWVGMKLQTARALHPIVDVDPTLFQRSESN